MRRRDFTTLLGGAAAAWPLAAPAQQPENIRRLGVIMGNSVTDPNGQALAAALLQGLSALDWREGGNLRIEWRWGGGGDPALFDHHAADLVALGADVLYAQTTPAVTTLRRATSTIPIVFANVTDPVGQGFVGSLARPGGNVTGFTDFDPLTAGKWLEMLTQIKPAVLHAAVLYNPATAPFAGLMLRAIQDAAQSFAVTAWAAPCRDKADIEAMMKELARKEGGGLLVLTDIFNATHRNEIVASAAERRLPVVYFNRSFAAVGGLMSYGIDQPDLFRRSANCRSYSAWHQTG
jgi:putative ABC transport system substrate-binding protein